MLLKRYMRSKSKENQKSCLIIKSNINKQSEGKGYDVIASWSQKRKWKERISGRVPRERHEKRMRLSLTHIIRGIIISIAFDWLQFKCDSLQIKFNSNRDSCFQRCAYDLKYIRSLKSDVLWELYYTRSSELQVFLKNTARASWNLFEDHGLDDFAVERLNLLKGLNSFQNRKTLWQHSKL